LIKEQRGKGLKNSKSWGEDFHNWDTTELKRGRSNRGGGMRGEER
jgi:hypothetical protein